MKRKQKKSKLHTKRPDYIALTRITVPELDTIIKRGEVFPNNLMLVNYDKLLAHKFIIDAISYSALDKTICHTCRAI